MKRTIILSMLIAAATLILTSLVGGVAAANAIHDNTYSDKSTSVY